MSFIRSQRDDYIPMLESYGIANLIEQDLTPYNAPMEAISFEIHKFIEINKLSLIDLTEAQIEQLYSDLANAGKLPKTLLFGGSNPTPKERPVAVGATGCSASDVWFSQYEGAAWDEATHHTGTFRFYKNGVLMATLTDYYITSLASLAAVSGDTIQISQVKDGVAGWWTKVTVP